MSTYLMRTLFVQSEGTRLVLDGNSVKALREDAPSRRLPLGVIDSIIVLAGVDVSTPLLVRCGEDGRTVVFLSRFGKPRAIVEGAISGRGQLRTLQYQAHLDQQVRSQIACLLVSGKLRQLSWGLRQWARDAEPSAAEILRNYASAIDTSQENLNGASRERALGIEGAATRCYFQGMSLAVKHQEFGGRTRRPPMDIVNALLSTVYSLTRMAVHGALHAVGLDPYCGFLHGDRDGQPSLVLDLMEEFRPEADRLAVIMLNRRQLRAEHFRTEVSGAVSITDEGMSVVFDTWHRYRTDSVSVRGFAEPMSRAFVPIAQANVLANSFRSGRLYHSHQLAVQ